MWLFAIWFAWLVIDLLFVTFGLHFVFNSFSKRGLALGLVVFVLVVEFVVSIFGCLLVFVISDCGLLWIFMFGCCLIVVLLNYLICLFFGYGYCLICVFVYVICFIFGFRFIVPAFVLLFVCSFAGFGLYICFVFVLFVFRVAVIMCLCLLPDSGFGSCCFIWVIVFYCLVLICSEGVVA